MLQLCHSARGNSHMDPERGNSNDPSSLAYGLAEITFGIEAVQAVVNQTKWDLKFPEIIARARSTDERVRSIARLPGGIVREIAARPECAFDFYTSPDRERLYAKYRHKTWPQPRAIDIEIESKGYVKVETQDALAG